jgi:hypothetical protein
MPKMLGGSGKSRVELKCNFCSISFIVWVPGRCRNSQRSLPINSHKSKLLKLWGKNDEPEAEHNSSPNSKWEKTGKLTKVNWA